MDEPYEAKILSVGPLTPGVARKGRIVSTEDDECIHLLPPGSCSICKHGIVRKFTPLIDFTAEFDGYCTKCDEPIKKGDDCTLMTNGEVDKVWHYACAHPDPWVAG